MAMVSKTGSYSSMPIHEQTSEPSFYEAFCINSSQLLGKCILINHYITTLLITNNQLDLIHG